MAGPASQVIRRFERLTGEPLEATSGAGIQRLVDAQVAEDDQLDYKVDAYDGTRAKDGAAEKSDEFRKDVTALANSRGGVLVLGVSDKQGMPGKVLGVVPPLEKIEGRLQAWLTSHVEPYLEVECVLVEGDDEAPSCVLVVVPQSPRRPHAVRPVAEPDSLRYARRIGRQTLWLGESQVADAYRDRFAAARTQIDRLDEIAAEARHTLMKKSWFLLTLSPEVPGELVINREALSRVDEWMQRYDAIDLVPNRPDFPRSTPEIGPRQVNLRGRDKTVVPVSYFVALHHDGCVAVAFELKRPGGNPSAYLDVLVGDTIEALQIAASLSTEVAGASVTGAVRAELIAESGSPYFLCFDASWEKPPKKLGDGSNTVLAETTVDLDAVASDPKDLVSAAAVLAARLANHFGEPDSKYLSYDGLVRVNQFHARDRNHHVVPRAKELGLEMDTSL